MSPRWKGNKEHLCTPIVALVQKTIPQLFEIFFQNNTNLQTISLVSTFSKLFSKLTSWVQKTHFWVLNWVHWTRFSIQIKFVELDLLANLANPKESRCNDILSTTTNLMKSRESKRNIMIFHSPNSLCFSQRGNNTPSTNPTKSREKHQQSRNPKTQIETSSTRIKKPTQRSKEKHQQTRRCYLLNPSSSPLGFDLWFVFYAFVVWVCSSAFVIWVYSLWEEERRK